MSVKIAVATQNGMVAGHFGRCPEYTIAEVEEGSVVQQMVLPNPGHEPGSRVFSPGRECRA